MKPCRVVHGDYRSGCDVCAKSRASEGWARTFGEPWPPPELPPGVEATDPPAAPPVTAPPVCRHRGDDLTGREKAARSLPMHRAYGWCDEPTRPLGEATCPCAGCGLGCRGYSPADLG